MITATSAFRSALFSFGAGKIVYYIQIAGYSRSFTNSAVFAAAMGAPCIDWLISVDDLNANINDLDGGADVLNLAFTVQDIQNLITADFPGFIFEGAQVTMMVGFESLGVADFCTVFVGFIDTVASINSNLEYYFSCVDVSAKLQQVIYQKADNGAQTDSNNIRTLSAHPLDILLDILTNQVVNADGSHGLAAGFIDTTKIQSYRDGPFSGLVFVFHLSTPPSALDFIKSQLMKPLGGYLWVNAAGKITVNFFYPLVGATPVQTLGPDSWLALPEAEQTDMINTVQMSFDKDDDNAAASGNYFANSTNEDAISVSRYGLYGEQQIQADGVRSAFQGYFIASLTSQLIFGRYGLKNLKFDQTAPESLWNTMLLEPGDIVAVTHPLIPDRQYGVMGISGRLFEILHRRFNFNEGRMTLTMLEASYLTSFGFFLIAPDGEASYPSASSADQQKYMFMSDDNGLYPGVGGGGGGGGTVVAVTNIENTLTGWKPVCILPSCNPGGTGIPTVTPTQTVGVTPPGGGAAAMKLTIRGNRDTNCLWVNRVAGSFNGCTYVHSDFYIYLGNNTACIEAFEIDLFNFDTDTHTEWMWGNQWNQHRGIWQTWDQLHNRWEDTHATIGLTPGAWTHVQQDMHRVVGDPGLYFDSVTVNGVKQVWGQKFPSGPLPAGWASEVGIQFQMDIGAAGSGGADAEIFIRNVNFTASTQASADPGSVKANLLG